MPRNPMDPAAAGALPPQGPGLPPGGMGPMPQAPVPSPTGQMPQSVAMPPMGDPATQGMDPAASVPPSPAIQVQDDLDDLEPIYPRWLIDRKTGKVKKPRKPTKSYCESAVLDDQGRYAALVNRFRDDLRTYRLMDRTVFDDLNLKDMEYFVSGSPAIQVHKVCNMLSNIEHTIQFPWKNEKEEIAAQRLENAAYYILDEANRHHRNGGNTDIKWDWVFSDMIYGRMVTRVMPDPEDPDLTLDIRVYDPATVYPTYGGKKGIVRVSCVYNESLDKILQTYGDDPKVNKKLIKKYTDADGKLDLNVTGEVREYWDQWYRWLEFDGEEVIPVSEHQIGKVPFAYTVAPGQMGSANMPGGGDPTKLELSSFVSLNSKGADMDLTQKGLSFFHHQRPALRQQAAMMSIAMTAAKQRLHPPMEKNTPYEDPGSPASLSTGDTNITRPGEEFRPMLTQGNAMDNGVVLSHLDKELQKGGLPDHLFGAMEGSNISGFAVESMVTAAKDQVQPYINDLETHITEVIDLALYHYRNMGHLFVDDDQGRWFIPMNGRGKDNTLSMGNGPSRPEFQQMMGMLMEMSGGVPPDLGAWQTMGLDQSTIPAPEPEDVYVTREDIIKIGTRPEVKLRSVHLQNMTMLANVASMLIDKKIWSRGRAMDEFNVKNPREEWNKILSEDAQTNPKMLELVMFPEALFQSGNMSGFLAYFSAVIAPILMQMQMGAPPPGGAPPDSGTATVQGDSQPMMGQGPGSPSGPGNAGPPGAMM